MTQYLFPLYIALAIYIGAALAFPSHARADVTDGLVGYWTLNGVDTTSVIADRSGNARHGYLHNGATSSAKVIGKKGQALNFDGTNDFVQVNSAPNLTGEHSVAFWMNPESFADYNQMIDSQVTADNQNDQYDAFLTSAGNVQVWHTSACTSVSSVSLNTWTHVVITYDSGNDVRIYLNGTLNQTCFDRLKEPLGATTLLRFGSRSASVFPYDGSLDEIRLYNRALTATEVSQIYNVGNALKKPPNNLGLVGYWSFDEGNGATATDFSGRGNHGSIGGGATWVNGRRGKALDFEADSTQSVSIGSGASLELTGAMTACAWVKPETVAASGFPSPIIAKATGGAISQYILDLTEGSGATGEVDLTWSNDAGTTEGWTTNDDAITLGQWHHVCASRVNADNVAIYVNGVSRSVLNAGGAAITTTSANTAIGTAGDLGTYYFDGLLDEVRLYNRSLTAPQVQALYQSGAVKAAVASTELARGTSLASGLVGHWTFDGADISDRVYDRSGSSNHGYFFGGLATSTAKTIGKLGQATRYTGGATTESIQVAENASLKPAGDMSFAMWVKPSTDFDDTAGCPVEGILTTAVTDFVSGYDVHINTCIGGTMGMLLGNGVALDEALNSADLSWEIGQWYHLVYVFDRTNYDVFFYRDGQLVTHVTAGNNTTQTHAASPLFIGRGASGASQAIRGALDDVRMYSRALTAQEAKQLYNLGRATIAQ